MICVHDFVGNLFRTLSQSQCNGPWALSSFNTLLHNNQCTWSECLNIPMATTLFFYCVLIVQLLRLV